MAAPAGQKPSGLDGVEVADTVLSHVDGEQGILILRGLRVEDLTSRVTYEDAVGLLLGGKVPAAAERERVRRELAEGRRWAHAQLPNLGNALASADGMEALRAAAAHLFGAVPALKLIGALAVFAAAWARRRAGQEPLAPDVEMSHAADFLRMVRGGRAAPAEVAALDAYLVTVIDHGMNASTFTARVIASTGSDRVSAIVGAIAALKGPLHGGAPGPVLDMLDAIASPARAEAWIQSELDAGRRIMGMGHRIYRVRDPRAFVLERAIEALEKNGGTAAGRLALARAVERTAERILRERHPDRPLRANVEFYTAVILEAVWLPRELFSPTFAVSRVAGWCAHVDEQEKTGRLIRPASRYVGPTPA